MLSYTSEMAENISSFEKPKFGSKFAKTELDPPALRLNISSIFDFKGVSRKSGAYICNKKLFLSLELKLHLIEAEKVSRALNSFSIFF